MNELEAKKVLTIIDMNYADSFRPMSDALLKGVAIMWAKSFETETYQEVHDLAFAYINAVAGKGKPTPADLKEFRSKTFFSGRLSEQEAWNLVMRGIRNSAYHSKEEFAKLPEICQQLVGSPTQLYEWAVTQDINFSVISSNFMRSYRARRESEDRMAAIPESVRERLTEAAEKMKAIDTNAPALLEEAEDEELPF